MNEMRRLVDDGAANPELLRLVRAARPPRPIDSAALERSRRHVVALGSVPAALGVLVWVKHAALGAVLGITVAAAASAPRWLEEPRDTLPAPASAAPRRETPARAVPRPVESSVAPEPSRAPSVVSEPAVSVDAGLSRELALLEAARSELERRPGSALALLAQHEREFSGGTLSLEREFLRVSALVRLGRRRDAEAHARALRARSPSSLYEQRLDAILGDAGSAP